MYQRCEFIDRDLDIRGNHGLLAFTGFLFLCCLHNHSSSLQNYCRMWAISHTTMWPHTNLHPTTSLNLISHHKLYFVPHNVIYFPRLQPLSMEVLHHLLLQLVEIGRNGFVRAFVWRMMASCISCKHKEEIKGSLELWCNLNVDIASKHGGYHIVQYLAVLNMHLI